MMGIDNKMTYSILMDALEFLPSLDFSVDDEPKKTLPKRRQGVE